MPGCSVIQLKTTYFGSNIYNTSNITNTIVILEKIQTVLKTNILALEILYYKETI
jgi:hypothetical protein